MNSKIPLFLIACFLASANLNAAYSTPENTTTQSNSTVNDKDVVEKVRKAISGGFFSKSYDNVSADVKNGVLTLRGTVSSESDVKTILDRVQKIEEIHQINNQIIIQKKS